MNIAIPTLLAVTCGKTPRRRTWLTELTGRIEAIARRWQLTLENPYEDEVSCSWVAPVTRSDGTAAVLKLGMPHMENEQEAEALRFWNGDGAVRLLEFDAATGAMLLERCEPGTTLRTLPEPEQDVVLAGLLRRLWRTPAEPAQFRPLSVLMEHWSRETLADRARWTDAGLVEAGLQLFRELPDSAPEQMVLATDLHAGNVLRAQRELWLVIDPKPFFGDPAYDATQHLINCEERLRSDANGTIRRFADLLEVDYERVRLWMFARSAAEPREDWTAKGACSLAKY